MALREKQLLSEIKRTGVVEFKFEELNPAVKKLLDQCPAIASKLVKEHSNAYDDFTVLWDGIRGLLDKGMRKEDAA